MSDKPKKPKFSYSSTDTFATCPLQYQQVSFLYRYRSESNAAAERGTEMHEEFEACVNLDCDFSDPQYQWILDEFRADTGLKIAEMQLAINNQWEPCDYKDPEAWYRGKIDFTCISGTHANVRDLKTGKRKMKDPVKEERWLIQRHTDGMREAPKMLSNARQANDYALLTFLHFPSIQTMDFKFVWSDVEGITEDTFEFDRHRDNEAMLKTMLNIPTQVQEALDTDTFTPKPSGLCYAHCPVLTCKYFGRRYREIQRMLEKEG